MFRIFLPRAGFKLSMKAWKAALGVVIFALGSLAEGAKAQTGHETNVALDRAAYQSSAINYDNVAHLATDGSLDTFWQSNVEDRPWIYIDLGQSRKIDGVQLAWGTLAPTNCTIQLSNQASRPSAWTDVVHLPGTSSQVGEAHFAPVDARFVRMIADAGSAPGGCQLREFRVSGEAATAPSPVDLHLPAKDEEDRISLDGAGWKLQNTLFVHDPGEAISKPDYSTDGWLTAKVPGTVLTSYLLDGAVPDPNFGDQQRLISESFFQNDFWYRREFILPVTTTSRHFLLNFEGINWKADIYLNGSQVGHIDGAFHRGRFEVTKNLLPGQRNVLAVLIHKVANPGATHERSLWKGTRNGGVLGKDNPTFQASIGWNWMVSIRGRDIGIWDHVFLEQTGPVVLTDPFVQSAVSQDQKTADLTLQFTLKNLEDKLVDGAVSGTLGNIAFTQKVQLAANETKTLTLDKSSFPQLSIENPQLWWPNGYGDQPLQHLKLAVSAAGIPSFEKEVVFGIRQLTYDTSNNVLKISCNGQHIQLNGGNWGMDETMLRYEAKDYDNAVRLHKEMHMTMIRNWVGQVGKEEFFDACDKYGLLVWNDFWLANPSDGNNPDDHPIFMDNVDDRILRIRNHPSLALYCGRNEGNPPKDLDAGMAQATSTLDGTRFYIPNSANGLVTGHGPYEPHAVSWYFHDGSTHKGGGGGIGTTLHSELGIVAVPTADSMRLMMPEQDLWPVSDDWAVHDFYQSRCKTYLARIDKSYGPSAGLDEFCEKAQMENWENAKAMLEAWRSESGSGCLIWMSHPAWPSLICQLYDYYLNPTGAYFGARLANEPLHILWDAFSNKIKVANNTGRDFKNLQAEAWIYNMDGTPKAHQEAQVNSSADGVATDCFDLTFPGDLSPVHFIKLKLTDGKEVVSENFYWRGITEDEDVTLNDMPKVKLTGSFTGKEENGKDLVDVRLENPTSQVALMVCLKIVKAGTPGERVLPVFYGDNYVSLLPHEARLVRAEFDPALLQGDRPAVVVQGWNVPKFNLGE
jgi:hypothetical protein